MLPLPDGVSFRVFESDCFDLLKTLPDSSVDLICIDPPYFRVKSDDWDNCWPSESAFLDWLEQVFLECDRVLASHGSFYVFAAGKMSSRVEERARRALKVLNHIVWVKPSGLFQKHCKEKLRNYLPASERIIFGEKSGSCAYKRAAAKISAEAMSPLISYFSAARDQSGVTNKEINTATGTQMAGHWFTSSQWQLPSEDTYKTLQSLMPQLDRSYESLQEELKKLQAISIEKQQDAKCLRRHFSVSKEVPYTDIWHFKPVQYYPGKHPCEKPADLIEHIITASSRPGDVVLDFFMGSASTGKAALKHGRRFIGADMNKDLVNNANKVLKTYL